MKAILHKALRGEPAERYATAEELRADLQACLWAAHGESYGAKAAAREVLVARMEAKDSPHREEARLLEWGIFPDDVPVNPGAGR